jgi:hypothetical protein
MANEKKPLEIGALLIDATEMAEFLVDLPPLATKGMQSEREGFDGTVAEITSNQATWGEQAGITKNDFDQLELENEQIAMIDMQLPAARKLVEMFEETRAKLDDRRQRRVSAIAKSVETRAKVLGSPDLLAKYEQTRAYRSAHAMKGVKTRRKNASATLAAAPADQPGDTTD